MCYTPVYALVLIAIRGSRRSIALRYALPPARLLPLPHALYLPGAGQDVSPRNLARFGTTPGGAITLLPLLSRHPYARFLLQDCAAQVFRASSSAVVRSLRACRFLTAARFYGDRLLLWACAY